MSQQNGRQQRPMFAYPSLSLVQVTGFRTQSRRPIFFVKRFANNRQLCILRKPVLKDSVKCFCFWHAFVSKKNRHSAMITATPHFSSAHSALSTFSGMVATNDVQARAR